ncbi:MAG: DUF1553 domain-containing protein [Planctomycetes bacterium]|nr:DUF1553 domain-containing protein [Planctomycetota bacterium]
MRPPLLLVAVALFLLAPPGAGPAAEPVRFNRDIRPILAESCFACHGPEPGSRKAGLRLDREEHAFLPAKSGKPVLVRGSPDESPLVARILSADEGRRMPPPESRKTLTDSQKQAIVRWVREGARYEEPWAFVAPEPPPVPAGGHEHPVDAFVAERLRSVGLSLSPEADRPALIRRASLDLTGLPPEPSEVEAFVEDDRPDAWERVIDRLLSSPHYGEERARRWLDVARYADTQGLHHDDYREIWPYRDWVVKASNEGMPFDRFTTEQLAGDLLPEAGDPQLQDSWLIATGYLRCNVSTAEGGVIPEEVAADVARDRIEAFGLGWLGLTVQCGQCHDHKFDPFTMRDFYQLAAIFRNGQDAPVEPAHRDHVEPTILVPAPADRARLEALRFEIALRTERIEAAEAAASADPAALQEKARAAVQAAEAAGPTFHLLPDLLLDPGALPGLERRGRVDVVEAAGADPAAIVVAGDGGLVLETEAGRFDGRGRFAILVRAKVPEEARGALLARMEPMRDFLGWDILLEDRRPAVHLVAKWPADAIKVIAKEPLPPGRWFALEITYDGSGTAAGMQIWLDGRRLGTDAERGRLSGVAASAAPLRLGSRDGGEWLRNYAVAEVKIWEGEPARARSLQLALRSALGEAGAGAASMRDLARAVLEATGASYREAVASLARARREEGEIAARSPRSRIMRERPGEPVAHLLVRGRYDQPGEQVRGDVPHVLPRLPDGAPRNRLGLAKWLFRPDHPLTARVFANRAWQELMGTGIVATAWDFGAMGEGPSHPELLDWLAVQLREGWDVKGLFRLIMTSAAYRQSPRATRERLEADPANRLLSRGPRHRLDGEVLRDLALAASGLLVRDIGGPPVRPYQPPGVWEAVAMLDSNTRAYTEDVGPGLYRRSLYTFIKRSARHPSMDAFNAPSREVCTIRRERTNTPLQALVLMNDPQLVEAARRMAENALTAASDGDARLDHIAVRLISRPLHAEERRIAREVLRELLEHYEARPDDAKALVRTGASAPNAALAPDELAAWTLAASQLLCLDAVLNK